jgi:hypothetical protein
VHLGVVERLADGLEADGAHARIDMLADATSISGRIARILDFLAAIFCERRSGGFSADAALLRFRGLLGWFGCSRHGEISGHGVGGARHMALEHVLDGELVGT